MEARRIRRLPAERQDRICAFAPPAAPGLDGAGHQELNDDRPAVGCGMVEIVVWEERRGEERAVLDPVLIPEILRVDQQVDVKAGAHQMSAPCSYGAVTRD